ncbi:aminopeptidase N [Citricoccus sp. NPDC055426]|uniref:aminopeptidase N n=1 Tax=Citricoccus sp. NPDC055426 TaxID=3155536 RepID=UPI0034343EF8
MVIDSTSGVASAPGAPLLPGGLPEGYLDRTNLTRDEAFARSSVLATRDYDVHLDLSTALDPESGGYRSTTTLRFSCTQPGTWTFLDFINSGVESVVLNGRSLEPGRVAGSARVLLEDLAAENEVTVTGIARYSTSGEGLHRFVDPSDGRTYLYTQYEPADARRVFATFEQPDLKARFTFHLTGPADWVLASNEAPAARRDAGTDGAGRDLVTVDFAPTQPMSTYITTLLAGPYAQRRDRWAGHPGSGAPEVPLALYCRASMADSLDAERIFSTTKAGLDFFHEQFGTPYPWGKYDQAFVPEYNLGAMENPGLVTFTEQYLFTSTATQAQYEARATTIMHEMAHMWFGDLVTMRWWDDLWLKESFADFMGTLAVAEATGFTGSWTTFANRRKGWAYLQDQYPTTHPIVADIPDLEAARQNFDGITYAKGASVLKQLVAYVGRDAFMAASREYFARHAWANASLDDFLAVLTAVSGRDLRPWADDWLQTSGVPELWVEDGALHQSGVDPVSGAELLRPHVLRVGVYSPDDVGRLARVRSLQVEVGSGTEGGRTPVAIPEALPAGHLVLPNDEDLTYAKIRLDEASLQAVLRYPVADGLAGATVWAALWNMTRDGLLPAGQFVEAVCRLSGTLGDAGLYGSVIDQAATAVDRYAPASERNTLRDRLGEVLVDALHTRGAGSDRQRSAARTFTRLARGAADAGAPDGGPALLPFLPVLQALTGVGPEAARERARLAPGLDVDAEIRWAAWQGLAALGRATPEELDATLAQDVSATHAVWHRTARAALPDPAVREAAWEAVMSGHTADGQTLSNDHLSATAAGFTASRPDLAEPFTERFWPHLEEVWASRSNGLASRTITGLFPARQDAITGTAAEQRDHPVVVAAQGWLDGHQDAPRALRRIIIEQTDDLLRSLRAQAAQGS